MKTYLVRRNCEFSVEVEAEDEDAAIAAATALPDEDWQQAWSEAEVEWDEEEV